MGRATASPAAGRVRFCENRCLSRFVGVGSAFEPADALCHLQEMLAHFLARDLAEMAHQLDLFAGEPLARAGRGLATELLEEERHRTIEEPCRLVEAAGAQPVLAMLVFLDRLEGDANAGAEFFLTHAGEETRLTEAATDMHIDWVGAVLANRATAAPCVVIALTNFGHIPTFPLLYNDRAINLYRIYTVTLAGLL